MTDDITTLVERLRTADIFDADRAVYLCNEAADALTAAQARIETLETSCGHCGELDKLSDRLAQVEKDRDAAREAAHYANGVADLAMKHRDQAEKDRDAAEDSQIRWAALAEKFEKERNAARAALREAALQIEYLHQRFKETGSGNGVLAKIRAVLSDHQTEEVQGKVKLGSNSDAEGE